MKHLKLNRSLQAIFVLLVVNCSSNLQMNDVSKNRSLEYITDSYKKLESSFPISKKTANDYVLKNILLLEDYFNKSIHLLTKDTAKISLEFQTGTRVVVSGLHSISDTNNVKAAINKDILKTQELDSASGYSINIELNVVKHDEKAQIFIKDINYATVIHRSKASIMRTIMQNIVLMRHEYNRILRQYPGVNGKITIKFVIDETGKVIYLKVVGSTMNNCLMENKAVDILKSWVYGTTEEKPNLTTVVYPFVFSQ